jgi:hypothetical protein
MTALTEPLDIVADGAASPPRLRVAVAASALLGCVYLFAVPTELQQWTPYAAVFLGIAAGHLALARALWRRPSSGALLAGVWGNLIVTGLYLVSRTVGLPFGPLRPLGRQPDGHAHAEVAGGIGNGVPFLPQPLGGTRIETVAPLGLGVVAAQFVLVMILVSLLPASARRWTTNTMFVCGLIFWGLRWNGVLG